MKNTYKIFVNGEFLMTFRGSYGDVLDFVWYIHFDNPSNDIEIVKD